MPLLVNPVTSIPPNPAQRDPMLQTLMALPAAGAGNSHASLDLGTSGTAVYPSNQRIALEIALPATPSLADTKTATLTISDSADNVTFAPIPQLAPVVATGAGGAGAAAQTVVFPLPGTTRRYLRVDQAVAAAGGNNTAVVAAVQLLVLL